ncbi:MAG: hypothetical protein ACRD5Z_08200 [Bryobacteraceae bacterium]
MITSLVATLGLLPAALSHGIGSDSQRPFASSSWADLSQHWRSVSFHCRRCTFGRLKKEMRFPLRSIRKSSGD